MTGGARVIGAERGQPRWDRVDLESQLPPEHRARVVWVFVETLDLTAFYAPIRARVGHAGVPATDPKVLLALWLYATLDGVGSARAVARLSEEHTAYRWLRGGAPINHNLLSEFRRAHAEPLDRLLTQSLTALLAEGLVEMAEVAIDGTKLRAAAGPSLAGRERLARLEAKVAERIAALKAELETDPAAGEARRRARAAQAAAEQMRRIEQAKARLDALEREKAARAKRHAKEEATKHAPRVSTTDPEARPMRLADGATCPAWNLQVAAADGFVLAIEPTDRRNDTGLAQGLLAQLRARCGRLPARLLGDSRSIVRRDILSFAETCPDLTVYSPPPSDKADVTAESRRKRAWRRTREPAPIQEWRLRMQSEAGQEIYRRRKHIERIHAQMKNRGLRRLLVRGREKVRAVALLHAIAHNLWRAHGLRPATP